MPADKSVKPPPPVKPMKQVDRPLMTYDKRRAKREMSRPIFSRRSTGKR